MLVRAISGAYYLKPRHRGMFAVDIASFGCRNPRLQLLLRETLYAIVRESCDAAGICWHRCHHQDRGDGIFAVVLSLINRPCLTESGPLWSRSQLIRPVSVRCHPIVLGSAL